jgi:hypothetical protein
MFYIQDVQKVSVEWMCRCKSEASKDWQHGRFLSMTVCCSHNVKCKIMLSEG